MKKLFTVIRQGKLDEVEMILEKKPELVNCVSGALPKKDHGQSPLQVALKTGKYEIADYLISHGADVNKSASNGFDSINWSICKAELLFERPTIYPNVQEKVREQLTRILDILIENGADYVAWANRGHYPEPYPGPSNKSMYIDDFVPGDETDIDRNRDLRLFMQDYFKSRNLKL